MVRRANGIEHLGSKDVFSTGEAAQICHVSQQTIIRCFDRGRIGGFRVPGSRYRRIPREELLRFMRSNEIPTDDVANEVHTRRVLVVEHDGDVRDAIAEALGDDGDLGLAVAVTAYDAGLMTQRYRPDVILLGRGMPGLDAASACRSIRSSADLDDTRIIVTGVPAAAEAAEMRRAGADGVVRTPLDPMRLRRRIDAVLRRRRR